MGRLIDDAPTVIEAEDCISRKEVEKLVYQYLRKETDDNIAFYENFLDLPSVTPKNDKPSGKREHSITFTKEEKQKAINALKISAPIMAVTQEEFNDYIQTLNKIMDWLEQETVSRESYEHEYFLRKEFEVKIDKLQRQLDKIRAEIEALPIPFTSAFEMKQGALEILDKYKAESEGEE